MILPDHHSITAVPDSKPLTVGEVSQDENTTDLYVLDL